MKKWVLAGACLLFLGGCRSEQLIQDHSYGANVYGKGPTLTQTELNRYSPWKQTIQFQKNGYTQTKDTYGTQAKTNHVFYQDKTGLYEVSFGGSALRQWEKDPAVKENVIEQVKKNPKRLIWKFAAKEGETWKSAGALYRIVKANYTLHGVYQSFSNITVVEQTEGTNVIRMYFSSSKGLVKKETILFDYDLEKK